MVNEANMVPVLTKLTVSQGRQTFHKQTEDKYILGQRPGKESNKGQRYRLNGKHTSDRWFRGGMNQRSKEQ